MQVDFDKSKLVSSSGDPTMSVLSLQQYATCEDNFTRNLGSKAVAEGFVLREILLP